MKRALIGAIALVYAVPAHAQEFSYEPAGVLVDGSGDGRMDETVYAPGIRFPMENAPAFANSQVWGHGGSQGPGGSQCDIENFSYPWHDNYCETRSWDMPLCPAGVGHQGQDIRAATCDKLMHWAVAAADGTITNVGSYSVYVSAADGTRYDYLHMGNVQVQVGDRVKVGDRLGMVSNEFGGTPTTVHLHFNIRQNVANVGNVFVPPYMSLVTAYSAMLDAPPLGYLDEVSCSAIRGWAFEPDTPEAPVTVNLSFDGSHTEPVAADLYRADLCENLGNCDHGFGRPSPLSLFDGTSYEVRAQVDYAMSTVELADSPAVMECAAIEPGGVLRKVTDPTFDAWGFSSFWDEAPVDELESLVRGIGWPEVPELVRDGEELWLIDNGVRRLVLDDESAAAWRFEGAAEGDASEWPEGDPLPARPVLVRDADGVYLMDGELDPNRPWPGGGQEDPVTASCSCRMAKTEHDAAWLGALLLGIGLLRRRPTGV
ncbi:MAG TPA: M23 family metallopeptidase [Polyangiaceae bacterium]|nr:M23 family metallopeptidase [Polyangiaceae bacterium]